MLNKGKKLLSLFVSSIALISESEVSKLSKKSFSFVRVISRLFEIFRFEIEEVPLLFNKDKELLSLFISSVFLIFEFEVFKLSKKLFSFDRVIFSIMVENNEEQSFRLGFIEFGFESNSSNRNVFH